MNVSPSWVMAYVPLIFGLTASCGPQQPAFEENQVTAARDGEADDADAVGETGDDGDDGRGAPELAGGSIDKPGDGSSDGGGNASGGDGPTGGNASGGDDPTGGNASGGDDPTGGNASGGDDPAGGNASGGNASGGKASGGDDPTGGNASGGDDPAGGNASGGNASGGDDPTGGNASGGDASGGNASGGNASGGNASGGNASGGGEPPETPEEVEESCRNATLQTMTQTVTFQRNQTVCDWSNGGNLSQLNGFFRARKEHKRSITLPDEVVICDIKFEFNDLSSMRYDDLMFLTMNDVLIAATQDYTFNFTKTKGDMFFYSWEDLKNKDFDKIPNLPVYCLGDGTECDIPGHDVAGEFNLNLSNDAIYDLSAQVLEDGYMDFSWIITGDNDGTDCKHDQDVSLEVQIKFY